MARQNAQQVIGRGRRVHVERHTIECDGLSQSTRDGPEHVPIIRDFRTRRRLHDRTRIRGVGPQHREALVVARRDITAFEHEPRRQHVMREPRGVGHERIDRDQQLEILERRRDLALIGNGVDGVAGVDEQRAHASRSRRGDFLGEHAAHSFTEDHAVSRAGSSARVPTIATAESLARGAG